MTKNFGFLALVSLSFLAVLTKFSIPYFAFASDPQYQEMLKKEALAKNPILPTTQFSEEQLVNKSICKYVGPRGVVGDDTSTPPTLFQNIRDIYLSTTTDGTTDPNFYLLSVDSVSNLAGCILERHLYRHSPVNDHAIPIHIFSGGINSISGRPEGQAKGRLIVLIDLAIHDGRDFPQRFETPIMLVQARFYRNEGLKIEDLNYQCSEPFPYERDKDKVAKFLTEALSKCLRNKYHPL